MASQTWTYVGTRNEYSCGKEATSWPHKGFLHFYEHFVVSKLHHQKIKTSNSRSVFVLELVHSNVWQAPVQSLGGAKYFLSFIDDYSRKCWVYPIKKKSDVFEVFKVYKAQVKLDSGKNIKCLRTDNGVELKTPMEMWTGKPINYSDLHIFGSPVYMMYNTQETTKLDQKSKKCLFLGYADGVKGHGLWDPTPHKMEKEFQSNNSFEAATQHEVNETNESQAPATHTLNRERRHPGWHSDYVIESNVAYCLLIEEGEPSTLQEALNNPDALFWKEAMHEEIEALHKNKTWELVPLLGGYAQKEGINFNEIFSPVVRMTTIRVVLARCVTYDLHLEQLDVKTAFLHGNLEEEIYML
ncbi:retrovirus-related pol polyprotein from transposon TNT 1-94, partial [Tanacetum coccineum]